MESTHHQSQFNSEQTSLSFNSFQNNNNSTDGQSESNLLQTQIQAQSKSDSQQSESIQQLDPIIDQSDKDSNLSFSQDEAVEDDDKYQEMDEEEQLERQNVNYIIQEDEEQMRILDEEDGKSQKDQEGEPKNKKQKNIKMTLRSFQANLLNNSRDTNSIIYLPTGTGKTRIAICAMYYYLCKFGTDKKIVFLANTIQLVKQQAEAIKQTFLSILQDKDFAEDLRLKLGDNYIDLNWKPEDINNQIICIHGQRNEDQTITKRKRIQSYMTSRKQFLNQMTNATITVMISQMFLNCLRRGYIKLTDYSFIVFDECHHCDGDHPYSGIMKQFYFDKKKQLIKQEQRNQSDITPAKLPVIMGLTASPVSQPFNDYQKLSKQLRQLCINLDSNYAFYPQGQNLTNQTQIDIQKIQQTEQKILLPDLINFLERYKDHPSAQKKIKNHFPQYYECVNKVLIHMARRHECLKVDYQGFKIVDPQLYLFYDIKECLLVKLRDLWLQLGQFAFALGFNEMVIELTRLSGLRNQENTLLLTQIIALLKEYNKKYNQQYGKCEMRFMSSKLQKLIQILKPQNQADINSTRVSDMVLVFAFKRRTVKYLHMVLQKYRDGLDQNIKKFYKSVGVTGYAGRQKCYKLQDGHSFESNPSAVEDQNIINKLYNDFVQTQRQQQNNRIHLQSSVIGDNKTLNDQMNRMYISKMGKVLLQVEQKYSNQIKKIIQFKKKEHRVLITTSVTQQGFDIPGCNLVISFDTPFSLKSYIQIKGRARKKNSKYIIFTNEKDYKKMIQNKKIYDNTINAIYELAINKISKEKLNTIGKVQDNPSYERVMTKAGAMLNTNYALELLKSYFTSLKKPNRPYFHFIQTSNICFKCIIKFPQSSTCSQSYVVGKAYSKKEEALKSAAYLAIITLKKQNFIKDDLRPSRLQQFQDQLEMEKYDDLGMYVKDSQYRQIFNRYVQIENCYDPKDPKSRKLLRFYFKSIQPQKLQFPQLNKEFNAKQFEKGQSSFIFQVYHIKFISGSNTNSSHTYLLKEDDQINEVGILTCFSKQQTKQVFKSFKQPLDSTTQQCFLMKQAIAQVSITKQEYQKYKAIHNFLLCGQKNNQIDYYNYMNNSPQVYSPNWNYKQTRKISLKIDENKKYFPLLIILRKTKEGGKYVIDENANQRIMKHQQLFKKIYTYHNKPAKYVYDKHFQQDLSSNYRILSDQVKSHNYKDKRLLIQCFSKDFCFHKGLIISNPEPYTKQIQAQQESKKRNRLKNKYQKLKKMYKHFQSESNIFKEQLIKFEIWKQTAKDDLNDYLNKQMKIKKNDEDKGSFKFMKEFALYPISYQTMLRVSLASKYIFPILEDYCIALYFRKYYLSQIFGSLKNKVKMPFYQFIYYPSVIMENGQTIFKQIQSTGKSKYLRNLGKLCSIYTNGLKFDMSSIHHNIGDVSQDQTINQNQSTVLFDKELMNTSQSIVQRIQPTISNMKQEEPQIKINLDVLKSLDIETILRSLTSKIYKHKKADNYQQFEFIGDVVLKFLATIQIFLEKVSSEQGQMHIARANLICNANLHRAGIKKKLFQYIFTTKKRNEPAPLVREYKKNKTIQEKQVYPKTDINVLGQYDDEEGYQYIPGKVHADAMQALIGVFYLKNKNLNDCQTLLYAFGILNKPTLQIQFRRAGDFTYAIPQIYSDLQAKIHYSFKNKGLLIQALTHSTFIGHIEDTIDDQQSFSRILSKTNNNSSNIMSFLSQQHPQKKSKFKKNEVFYQRLQFLGDSFLDLLVVEYLYDKNGVYLNDQGTLSFLKQSAVSNKTLGYIALQFSLQDLILMDLDDIDSTMKQFRQINKNIKGLPSPIEFSKLKIGSLKILGDVFESLVGAILIDNQFRYEETKEIVMGMIHKYVQHFTSLSFIQQCPTYKYKEFLDQNNFKKIKLEKVKQQGIVDGNYLYRFTDKSGSIVGNQIRASNEKDAWDKFFENKSMEP